MSRIDISIRNKKNKEWVANKGFCRSSDLELFCENSENDRLIDFDDRIVIGISLNKDNISNFLEELQFIIFSLKKNNNSYKGVEKDMLNEFIINISKGKCFLEKFMQENNLDDYTIKIV